MESVLGRVTAGPDDFSTVYPVREDSALLREFATASPGETVVEVGCGRGEVALALAEQGARTLATDVNPSALRWVRSQARRRRLSLGTVRTDLLSGLRRFDRIFANPPYLPTTEVSKDPDRWVDASLNGGPDGARITVRLIDELVEHLTPCGSAWILLSSRQNPEAVEAARDRFRRNGGVVGAVGRRDLEGEGLWVERFRVPPFPNQPVV